jgi:CBS-domain-containing membrane protein
MHAGDIRRPAAAPATTETVGELFDTIVSKPATIGEDAVLRDAVNAILHSGITRKAYVVDASGRLRGTITVETLMRHVAYRLGARPPGIVSWFRFIRDMESDAVKDFMARPASVTRQTPIGEIVRRVAEEHLNDLPVVDDEGRLIGEVNTFDLLKATRGVFSGAGDVPGKPG